MNLPKIYSQATRGIPKVPLGELQPQSSPTEELLAKQHLIDWKTDSNTVKMFKEMGDEAVNLVDQAIELALSYHQHNNHIQIISLLIRANTIRKQINTYANTNS